MFPQPKYETLHNLPVPLRMLLNQGSHLNLTSPHPENTPPTQLQNPCMICSPKPNTAAPFWVFGIKTPPPCALLNHRPPGPQSHFTPPQQIFPLPKYKPSA
ncbi:hypothetical protein PILCRDRAFT_13266 [Piloderma croceum F 1598]|uniref:Uncharacterized protein n=1 Tax=Piloderma croceum (strain F 1598) TaxID=765440 RepID=A0A0C3BEL1_PILCF|nr:hypothetical protein PILCRDRAFT_13266 [Piloderma croceum F 1598]